MKRVLFTLALLGGVFACQNYDFHHISATPVRVSAVDASVNAAPGTPYIMVIQDMSGSMCEPIQDGGIVLADSGSGAGDCAADEARDSKIGLVATNLSAVLNKLPNGRDGGNPFYIGLTTFPSNADGGGEVSSCSAPGAPQIPLGLASTTIPLIDQFYTTAVGRIAGGTPTAEAMSAAASFFPQTSANIRKYMLLLTDGLPNCNLLHPCVIDNEPWKPDGVAHGCMSPNASAVQLTLPPNETAPAGCQCSYGSCPDPTGPGASQQCCFADPSISAPGQLVYEVAAAQCLDSTHSIDVAGGIFQDAGIKIFVIGMGEDFNDFTLLDDIAAAGQGDAGAKHIQADNQAELYNAIYGILSEITQSCSYTLSSTPANPGLIQVTLDGMTLGTPADFTYSDGIGDAGVGVPTITLVGQACNTLENGDQHNLTITLIAGT